MSDEPLFLCPRCGARSWSPDDAMWQYCGACHRYVDEPAESVYAPGEWEAQQIAWRALVADPDRLARMVAVLREHGLRLTESGSVELADG